MRRAILIALGIGILIGQAHAAETMNMVNLLRAASDGLHNCLELAKYEQDPGRAAMACIQAYNIMVGTRFAQPVK